MKVTNRYIFWQVSRQKGPWEAEAGKGDGAHGLGRWGVCAPITESGTHEMEIIGGLELRINDRDDSLG